MAWQTGRDAGRNQGAALRHHLLEVTGGFPGGAAGKKPTCQQRRLKRRRFNSWVRKIPWNRKWQRAPVFLPEKSHGQRILVDYSPWGHKESDTTEHARMHEDHKSIKCGRQRRTRSVVCDLNNSLGLPVAIDQNSWDCSRGSEFDTPSPTKLIFSRGNYRMRAAGGLS